MGFLFWSKVKGSNKSFPIILHSSCRLLFINRKSKANEWEENYSVQFNKCLLSLNSLFQKSILRVFCFFLISSLCSVVCPCDFYEWCVWVFIVCVYVQHWIGIFFLLSNSILLWFGPEKTVKLSYIQYMTSAFRFSCNPSNFDKFVVT